MANSSTRPVYLPGLRNLKTALAILIILLLSKFMNYQMPIYAGIAAITSMQDSIPNSIAYGKMRVAATLVGGVISILALFIINLVPNVAFHALLISAGIVLAILICNLIHYREASSLAAVVYFIIVMQYTGDPYTYAVIRIVETIAGIAIAVTVNKLVKSPD